MSSAGTRALFRRTKKYNRLFALFITSLTWLFHLRLHKIVTPRILADSAFSNFFAIDQEGSEMVFLPFVVDDHNFAFVSVKLHLLCFGPILHHFDSGLGVT